MKLSRLCSPFDIKFGKMDLPLFRDSEENDRRLRGYFTIEGLRESRDILAFHGMYR
jgi:hypothetical protein